MSLFLSKEEKLRRSQANAEDRWKNGLIVNQSYARISSVRYEMANGDISILRPETKSLFLNFGQTEIKFHDSKHYLHVLYRYLVNDLFSKVTLQEPPEIDSWDDSNIPSTDHSEDSIACFIDHDWGWGKNIYVHYGISWNLSEDGLLPICISVGDKKTEEIISRTELSLGICSGYCVAIGEDKVDKELALRAHYFWGNPVGHDLLWIIREGLTGRYAVDKSLDSDVIKAVLPNEKLKAYGLFGIINDPTENGGDRRDWNFSMWPHHRLSLFR